MVCPRRQAETPGKSSNSSLSRTTVDADSKVALKMATIGAMFGGFIQQALVLTATWTCLCAFTFPLSETSSGRNYN